MTIKYFKDSFNVSRSCAYIYAVKHLKLHLTRSHVLRPCARQVLPRYNRSYHRRLATRWIFRSLDTSGTALVPADQEILC
jgi:hypothetical protein